MRPPGLVVAHRAANTAEALAAVDAAAVDVVEADVHLFHGRLELRHAKVLWPLAAQWERWYLLPREAPRPALRLLLPLIPSGVDLMLDLKGPDPRLAAAVLEETREFRAERGLWVSGRVWPTIDRMRGAHGVRAMHSVAGPRELARLLRRAERRPPEGVSIHQRLLTPRVAAALRARAEHLWTWPVDDPVSASVLASWGVTGFISDAPGRLAG